jgi:FdhD protein
MGGRRSPFRLLPMALSKVEIDRSRLSPGTEQLQQDWLAAEEPLEIRIHGTALAVLLRTPGDERSLIAGFLASECILHGRADVQAIEACRDPNTGQLEANIWNVSLAEGVAFEPTARRFLPIGSACGLCGTRSITELRREIPVIPSAPAKIAADLFDRVLLRMRNAQPVHQSTSGSHGACLFDPQSGKVLEIAEDIGRHNAVDKVLGARLLLDDYPAETSCGLLVSGRLSFEIIQKAALAGVSMVAGAGAPTSLAVEAANDFGLTLFGLIRPTSANRYCGVTVWEAPQS